MNHVRYPCSLRTLPPRPRSAGRGADRRLRRRRRFHPRARQVERPPDRRASGRCRTGGRAPHAPGVAEDNPDPRPPSIRTPGRATWIMPAASPSRAWKPSAASARRTTNCSKACRRRRSSGPARIRKTVRSLCAGWWKVTRSMPKITPANCRRFARHTRPRRAKNSALH